MTQRSWPLLLMKCMLFVACASADRGGYVVIQHPSQPTRARLLAGPAWGWPAFQTLRCLEVAPGMTVLVPPESAQIWERPPEMEHPYDRRFSWSGPEGRRTLEVDYRQRLPISSSASATEKREVLLRELVGEDPPLAGVRPIELGSFPGIAHESRWEGMIVWRRAYAVGNEGLILYAASAEGDPFPEAMSFFESLAVKEKGAAASQPEPVGREGCMPSRPPDNGDG